MDSLKQLIQERYPLLPVDIKKYLISQEFSSTVDKISLENNLNEDQQRSLTTEIFLVLLAVENPNDLIKNTKDQLAVDEQKAKKVSDSVNEKIFQPLYSSLQDIFSVEDSSDASQDNAALAKKIKIETRTDHILPPEAEEKLLTDGNIQQASSSSQANSAQPIQKSPQSQPRKPFNYPLSTESGPIQPPPAPVSAFQTLEKDFDQVAESQKNSQSLAEQKLKKITGLPEERKTFEIPDPKNRTYDPYREPLD